MARQHIEDAISIIWKEIDKLMFEKDNETIQAFTAAIFALHKLDTARIAEGETYIDPAKADDSETYMDGVNEAWECARKVCLDICDDGFTPEELEEIFEDKSFRNILRDNTGYEAVTKLKRYQDKQPATHCSTCKHNGDDTPDGFRNGCSGCKDCSKYERAINDDITVGTRVRTLEDNAGGVELFPIGTIGVVGDIDADDECPYRVDVGDEHWWYSRDMVEVVPWNEVLVGDVVESTYYTDHMPEGIKGVVISVEHHQQGADAYRILWADGHTSTEFSDDFKQTNEYCVEMRTIYSKIKTE